MADDLTTHTNGSQVATTFHRKALIPQVNKRQSPISTIKNLGKTGIGNNLVGRPGGRAKYNSISGR